MCMITGLDEGENLSFIYHLAHFNGIMIDLKTYAPKNNPVIKTVTDTFPGSDLYERELVDLLGAKIEGLPTNLENNTEYTAKVTGDLTISGVTKEVPFDATVKYADDASLTVHAKTQLTYEDFGIVVPNLPFLSDVSKVVDLHMVLVAR